jgi:hypothetical protein
MRHSRLKTELHINRPIVAAQQLPPRLGLRLSYYDRQPPGHTGDVGIGLLLRQHGQPQPGHADQ